MKVDSHTEGDDPFFHFPATVLQQALSHHTDEDLKLFLESWEELPVDRYMNDGGEYRRRRYGSFHFVDDQLVPDLTTVFFQSTQVNSMHGGMRRQFSELSESVRASGVLHSVVDHFLNRLPGEFDRSTGGVGVHQIRILATRDETGLPTPEGVHRDGHHYVAQALVRRTDIEGGASWLYDLGGLPRFTTTLREPFESIVLDDRRVLHGVSAVQPAQGTHQGVRDMLLIDFFPRQA